MDKQRDKLRITVQALFAAVTNGYAVGFLEGKIYTGKSKYLCVPGLNCYSCPGALGSCPIGSLQAVLGSRDYYFAFYVIGFLFAFGAFFGRLICGWLCPFGLAQDLLYKIPFVKKLHRLPGERWLARIKYALLFIFVILLPLVALDIIGQGQPWFCKYICPSGTLMGGLPLAAANEGIRTAIGGLFFWKVFLLMAVVVLSVIVYRPFCRYLCPLGAVYGFFNPIAFYRLQIDPEACTGCKKCQKTCKLDIPVYQTPNSMQCIRCGECMNACPHQAIGSTAKQWGQGRRKKQGKEIGGGRVK